MESVLSALVVYAVILLMTRISGRRTLSQVTVFDFVLVLLIADTSQNVLVGTDGSVTNAIVLIAVLILTDVVLTLTKSRFRWINLLVDGAPTVLIREGVADRNAMTQSRVGMEDILQSARMQHGILREDEIGWAVLETSGNISIVPADRDAEGGGGAAGKQRMRGE